MSGCCGGTRTVVVLTEYLTVDGDTCDRCGDTRDAARRAVSDAAGLLDAAGVEIELLERELGAERLGDSNRVLVNGRPAEEWLGGSASLSDCPSCAELIGEPACCREVEVGGVRTEAVSREIVLDAILAAAGLAPVGVPGAACCGDAGTSPTRSSLAVTIVTGAGCG